MTMEQYIREHRARLDRYIQAKVPGAPTCDRERRLWVLNDEQLYLEAQRAGVRP